MPYTARGTAYTHATRTICDVTHETRTYVLQVSMCFLTINGDTEARKRVECFDRFGSLTRDLGQFVDLMSNVGSTQNVGTYMVGPGSRKFLWTRYEKSLGFRNGILCTDPGRNAESVATPHKYPSEPGSTLQCTVKVLRRFRI